MDKSTIQIIKKIISEEIDSLVQNTPLLDKKVIGVVSTPMEGDSLPSPSEVKPVDSKGEYPNFEYDYADLVHHHDYVPPDETQKYRGDANLLTIMAERFSISHKNKMFRASHKAKNRCKELREGSEEFSNLKHAIVSEYIESISKYIDCISKYDKIIAEEVKNLLPELKEVDDSASILLKTLANISEMEIPKSFVNFLKEVEEKTKYDLIV
jgi:hypothetical protein